ncbi:VTC domain-containing protein [Deinococcus sp. SM5_A1]|uniref:VTC domain-containing protein n=1 Tax=Deinococcus sp. SM5_A1 TaxID=3379094 RepID=UPI00385D594E
MQHRAPFRRSSPALGGHFKESSPWKSELGSSTHIQDFFCDKCSKRRERGATVKLRVPCNENISTESEFLRGHGVDSQQLIPRVAVFYDRITLVRTLPTPERVTFDLNLRLVHVGSSQECRFSHSVITELKTPGGLHQSHFAACARRCGLRTAAISKYGVGVSLLHPQVMSNLMRPQLRRLQQIELQGAS